MPEQLESRVLLSGTGAGNIVATLNKGALTIVGDEYGNYVQVELNDAVIEVTGTGTTVNGSTSSLSIPVSQLTGSMSFKLLGGNDRLILAGFITSKKITADMGSGDNSFLAASCAFAGATLSAGSGDDAWNFSGSTSTGMVSLASGEGDNTVQAWYSSFSGNVTIGAGNGYDSIDFRDAQVTGNVAVSTGDGGSSVTLQCTSTAPRIRGSLSVKCGEGGDYLNITTGRVDGNIKADFGHGSGEHAFIASNSTLGGNVTLASLDGVGTYSFSATSVAGSVSANSQFETGTAVFGQGSTIGGNVSLTCQQAPLSLTIRGATINGNVTLRNGAGSGSFVNINSLQSATHILGKVDARFGTGDKQVTLNDVEIDGAVSFDLGGGNHTVELTNGTSLGSSLSIKGLGRRTRVTLFEVDVAGPTTITTGVGHDTVTIDDCNFLGAFTLNTGAGNDVVNIQRIGGTTGTLSVLSQLATIDLGDDNDQISLGDANSARAVRFLAASRILGGKGIDTRTLTLDGGLTPTVTGFEG